MAVSFTDKTFCQSLSVISTKNGGMHTAPTIYSLALEGLIEIFSGLEFDPSKSSDNAAHSESNEVPSVGSNVEEGTKENDRVDHGSGHATTQKQQREQVRLLVHGDSLGGLGNARNGRPALAVATAADGLHIKRAVVVPVVVVKCRVAAIDAKTILRFWKKSLAYLLHDSARGELAVLALLDGAREAIPSKVRDVAVHRIPASIASDLRHLGGLKLRLALVGLHPDQGGLDTISNARGKRFGPLADGLRGDAYRVGGGRDRSTEQFYGASFKHDGR